MNGSEKRTNELKLRFTDTEINKLSLLANMDDRTLTDYVHHIIHERLFGIASRLPTCNDYDNSSNKG